MGIAIGYVLSILLTLTGGVFSYFCIAEFYHFAVKNLEWLAILFIIIGVATTLSGIYMIFSMAKKN
ncbi:MAG: hypothetical protein WC958_00250 [Dehalococcoidales bacterium]